MNEETELSESGSAPEKRSFLLRLACGFFIGVGGFLPGVSGGVMAVSLGLYRPIIDALADLFKDFRRHFLFLLPIGIGGVLGVVVTIIGLGFLFETFKTQVMYLFLGLVAGGVPSLIREANAKGFQKRYLIATAVGALLASSMLLFKLGDGAEAVQKLAPWQAAVSGAIITVGVLVPGLSTSFILMFFGWYEPMLRVFTDCVLGFLALVGLSSHAPLQWGDVLTMVFIGLGAVVFALMTLKAASYAYKHFHGYAYYGTLGFLIVSAILIFPGIGLSLTYLVSVLLAIGGFFVAIFFEKLGK